MKAAFKLSEHCRKWYLCDYVMVCSHWTTPSPTKIPRLTTIIMGPTVISWALHTAPRPYHWCDWLISAISSVSLHLSFLVSLSVNIPLVRSWTKCLLFGFNCKLKRLLYFTELTNHFSSEYHKIITSSCVAMGVNTLSNFMRLLPGARTSWSFGNSRQFGIESSRRHRQKTRMLPLISCNYKLMERGNNCTKAFH